jgi:septal ring factor EnvC (AmiA/AmiB activator)
MAAQHVRHQIEALQQQVAALRSAVTSPAQGQEGLREMLAALQGSLQALQVAEGSLHQQHAELASWSSSKPRRCCATVRHARHSADRGGRDHHH